MKQKTTASTVALWVFSGVMGMLFALSHYKLEMFAAWTLGLSLVWALQEIGDAIKMK